MQMTAFTLHINASSLLYHSIIIMNMIQTTYIFQTTVELFWTNSFAHSFFHPPPCTSTPLDKSNVIPSSFRRTVLYKNAANHKVKPNIKILCPDTFQDSFRPSTSRCISSSNAYNFLAPKIEKPKIPAPLAENIAYSSQQKDNQE